MDTFYAIQIQIIQFLQGLGEWLQTPFQAITFLGNLEFYLLIAPALYWCLDMGAGLRLGIFLILTGSVNTYFKFLFHAPRPNWITSQLQAMVYENSFGNPSGHAQNAVVVFGSITRPFRQRWVLGLVTILAFLVGLSRIYLAAHFLSDVLAGWVIGCVLLWTALKAEPIVLAWFKKQAQTTRYFSVFGISLGIIFLGWIMSWAFAVWELPAEWTANAGAAFPDRPPLNPFNLSGLVAYAGVFFGLTNGAIYLANRGGVRIQGSPLQLVGRYLLGVVGLLAIFIGLDLLFPEGENLIAIVFRYVRYSMAGIWVSALAPILFQKLKLAE